MPLDPKCQELIEQLFPPGAPSISDLPVGDAREATNQMLAAWATAEPKVAATDRAIAGPAGDIPLRIYHPEGATGTLPVLVYFHGGGWVLGGIDSHDSVCRALTRAAGCVTVSVGYRLAPEHKFPEPFNDCYAAVQWVAERGTDAGADPSRIAVGGDSAGGNLAAAVALAARDRGGPKLIHQLLICPAIDPTCDTGSQRDLAEGYMLTQRDMHWFWGQYLPGALAATDPYACPLRAGSLRGLPPATVITGEFDPLRDEGEAYAARLAQAGVPVKAKRYEGVIHGFCPWRAQSIRGKWRWHSRRKH